ncbi:hypothetical protein INT46_001530, partial [Mucor plumbeus]
MYSKFTDNSITLPDNDYAEHNFDGAEVNDNYFETVDLNIPYKTSGTFIDGDDPVCVYDDRSTYQNMKKFELYSIHLADLVAEYAVPRECHRQLVRLMNTMIRDHDIMMQEAPDSQIMHGTVVDEFLKKKASFVAHEYDTCVNGCKLYNVNDEQGVCSECGSDRFGENDRPIQKMKILSVGDIVSKLLSNRKTREELSYRTNHGRTPGHIKDFFDGEVYQQLINQGKFQNPDDIAVMLFTDGFVKD